MYSATVYLSDDEQLFLACERLLNTEKNRNTTKVIRYIIYNIQYTCTQTLSTELPAISYFDLGHWSIFRKIMLCLGYIRSLMVLKRISWTESSCFRMNWASMQTFVFKQSDTYAMHRYVSLASYVYNFSSIDGILGLFSQRQK